MWNDLHNMQGNVGQLVLKLTRLVTKSIGMVSDMG